MVGITIDASPGGAKSRATQAPAASIESQHELIA